MYIIASISKLSFPRLKTIKYDHKIKIFPNSRSDLKPKHLACEPSTLTRESERCKCLCSTKHVQSLAVKYTNVEKKSVTETGTVFVRNA